MSEISGSNNPSIFKELPKEQRKALQKEYYATAEAKKISKTLTIVAVVIGAIVIASAIIGLLTSHQSFFTPSPAIIFCVIPAAISQNKFEKWLASEKNIVMKQKNRSATTKAINSSF